MNPAIWGRVPCWRLERFEPFQGRAQNRLFQAGRKQVHGSPLGAPCAPGQPAGRTARAKGLTREMMAASAERGWPALLRKLDRDNPGYDS